MEFFIGVEGVSLRQCVAVASDPDGKVLSAVRLRGRPLALHTIDRDVFRIRIVELLSQLCQEIGISLNDLIRTTICIGVSGATFPHEFLFELPNEFHVAELQIHSLICTGDIEVILASHTQKDAGSAIVSHMGSVALVATPKGSVRLGGWGPVFGDEGSGYWIGRRALRAIGREYENREPPSVLWSKINSWLLDSRDTDQVPDWRAASILWRKWIEGYEHKGSDPRTALLCFAHSLFLQREWQWRAIASSLVIPVMQAWEAGDLAARDIVTTAANDLTKLYKRAHDQMGISVSAEPMVLYGGVLNHNHRFRQLLIDRLSASKLLSSQVITNSSESTMRPACGALLFALGHSRTGCLRLPAQSVIRNVFETQNKQGELRND